MDGDRPHTQRSPREQQPTSARSERTRQAPTTSRSTTAVGQPPIGTELPRENSAVINRIVVDDIDTDIAREEIRQAQTAGRPQVPTSQMAAMNMEDTAEPPPVQRSRQEHLKNATPQRKDVKFGDYYLGQTIGEGEFGKVKLGWKKDSETQVAIKFIKKDQAGTTNRLPKIRREISILRELQHPNIVRLHEFVETERHMGIILEYASGGELFDYILNHRYLKDSAAKRLFAELISGVGYLHQKGIVHRDLKLENLLLDRHKHIIITDFGFANTFDPKDELGTEVEGRIADKEFVKSRGLDKLRRTRSGRDLGWRRGDLMQTSCGSPCYAAPELVVQDGLYCGRKVDVWSCGVILVSADLYTHASALFYANHTQYAMLAGYLPWDDDPANPDGDNINLLYKYISNTPITFPEYVTPHSRDLLRRILQHKPENRADMFEVVRHSWMSEYTHVVGFIGSKVTNASAGHAAEQQETEAQLGRSASVREPSSRTPNTDRASMSAAKHGVSASMGGDEASDARSKQHTKRNTVQIEYKTPQGSTARGDRGQNTSKPLPSASTPVIPGYPSRVTSQGQAHAVPNESSRREKETSAIEKAGNRATSDSTSAFGSVAPVSRPNTSGTFGPSTRLPSRGNSYSQPSMAQPTTTTAQGSFSQPSKPGSGYIIAGSSPGEGGTVDAAGRPISEQNRTSSSHFPTPQLPYAQGKPSGHRRSSTLGSLADKMLKRTNSRRTSQQENGAGPSEKRDRRYPPVSMKNAMPPSGDDYQTRTSSDSRRPSFGFSRKASKEREPSIQGRKTSRRFSWLPGSLGMANFTSKKEQGYESGDDGYRPPPRDPYQQPPMSQQSQQSRMSRPESKGMAFGRGASETPSEETTNSTIPLYYEDDREKTREQARQYRQRTRDSRDHRQLDKALPPSPAALPGLGEPQNQINSPQSVQRKQYRDDGYGSQVMDHQRNQDPVERFYTPSQEPDAAGLLQPQPEQYKLSGQGEWQQYEANDHQSSLRPPHRKFGYDDHGPGGSSSAAKKVMNFFRRRKEGEA